MNIDEIRKLLLEFGAPKGRVQECLLVPEDVLERFAAAIRAATKEEDAGICDDRYKERSANGLPREAASARSLAEAIRASK